MGPTNEFLDAAQIAPFVQRLADPVPEVRIAGFEAITHLPLQAQTWRDVITYWLGALSRRLPTNA